MIKIEIADLQDLDKKALTAIGRMFIELAEVEETLITLGSPFKVVGNNPDPRDQDVKINDIVKIVTEKVQENFTIKVPDYNKSPGIVKPEQDTDASGIAWDKNIHSRTKSKDEHGNWKLQRGKTEFAPPPPPANVVLASSDPVVPDKRTFPNLITIVTKAVADGRIHQTRILEILNAHGVPNLPALPTRPDDVVKVWDDLVGACGHV